MRSLFFKIFLWFWLAMVAIGLTMLLVMVASPPVPLMPPQRGVIASTLEFQAQRAAGIYEDEGQEALDKFLESAERQVGGKLYFFDGNRRELRTGKFTPEIAHAYRSALRQHAAIVEADGPDLLAAHRTVENGKTYVLVGIIPRAFINAARLGLSAIPMRTRITRVLALLAITGLVCYALARYIASPATKLRGATRRLAAGDLSTRVAPQLGRRRDELADLARDFDNMAERIGVLVSSQQQLLRDISHELRSPLTRLRLSLELARRESGQRSNHLDRIEREAEKLDELIGQLLVLTRLESGALALQREPVDLQQVAAEVCADADFEARALDKIVLLSSAPEAWVQGEPALLKSAIENVVRNAVRHTPDGSAVEVCLIEESQAAVVRVCDSGTGVPAQALPHLFEPFFRVEDARERERGGVGLGLAIAQRAAVSHGGKISASNRDVGGLCVEIHLPT